MKRYILNITLLFATFILSTATAWGQNWISIDGTWNGGSISSGNYKLVNNNTKLTNTLVIGNGKNVTIDLNGLVLYVNSGLEYVISVENGGTLTIMDSRPNHGHRCRLQDGLLIWPAAENDSNLVTIGGGIIYNQYKNDATSTCGISVAGTLNIKCAKIVGCHAVQHLGAAVVVTSTGTFNMEGGEIRYNFSGGNKDKLAGVIYGEPCHDNQGSIINISNTKISDNKTTGNGGAICAFNVTLDNCAISNNSAYFEHKRSDDNVTYNNASGGAIYVRNNGQSGSSANYGGKLLIKNCNISFNQAGNGGGIYVNTPCEITGTTIEYNLAFVTGGGIFATGNTSISNSKIIGNRAMSTETASPLVNLGRGGGFNFSGNLEFVLDNTIVSNNAAMHYGGGGQIQLSANLQIKNSTKIDSNTTVLNGAGGLHITSGAKFDMLPTTSISYNTSGGVGGGIHSSYQCVINLNGGDISHNTVYGRGGGVHINTGGDLVLNGTNITDNKSYRSEKFIGAEVYKDADGKFQWRNIIKDPSKYAEGYGGGILINSGSCTMNKGELSKNYADEIGGGIALVMAEASGEYFDDVRLAVFTLNDGNVSSNTTKGNGAGIYLKENILSNLTEDEKNKYTQIVAGGDWTPEIILNGGTISNNVAQGDGGGIYQEQLTEFTVSEGKTTTITENQAKNKGGAVYIAKGEFTVAGTAIITKNKAIEQDGGAVFLGAGSAEIPSKFTVTSTGKLTIGGDAEADANTANSGNGGGVYCAGSFTVASGGDVKINHNKAQNGGGFCINNGAVTLPQGTVAYNSATQYGGGLYLTNAELTAKTATFAGAGTFDSNTAKAGGGIYADGPINLNLSANVKNNTAENGGGIYISGGVQMKFGNGLIVGNRAETTAEKPGTAYQKNAGGVSGVGGGIFMGSGKSSDRKTELRFREVIDPANASNDVFPDNMGIYNNVATWAAADIFANGANTLIELPDISGLNLKDFDVPGNQLYWVEDYVTDDTAYESGTKVGSGGFRYEDALKDTSLAINRLMYNSGTTDNVLGGKTWKMKNISAYACLDLGYDYVFLHLIKKSLDNGDDATFVFSSKRDHDEDPATPDIWVPYTQVLFIGNGADVERIIGLPSGDWKIEESNWSYKYEALNQSSFAPVQPTKTDEFVFRVTRDGIGAEGASSGDLNKDTDGNVKLVVTNTHKEEIGGDGGSSPAVNIKNINEYNHRKVNILKPTTGN